MSSYQHRYFGQKQDTTGKRLFWNGNDDIPFRGAFAPDLNQQEYENLKVVCDSNTRFLDLSKQDDLDFYNMIIDQCAKGYSVLRKELIHPTDNSWRVLLQWFDVHKEMPNKEQQLTGI